MTRAKAGGVGVCLYVNKIIRKETKRRKSKNGEREDERNWGVIICRDYFICRVTNPSALTCYLFGSIVMFLLRRNSMA